MRFKVWLEAEWSRFGHQKTFDFLHEPENPFYRQATSFINPNERGYDFDQRYERTMLYHVTTALNLVKASGRLKSRSQLKDVVGLGGGANNEDPNLVSLTYSYERSFRIYEEMKYVISICQNKISALDIYKGFSDEIYDYDEENLNSIEQLLASYTSVKLVNKAIELNDWSVVAKKLEKAIPNGMSKYTFFQQLENEVVKDHEESLDGNDELPIIGFTAPFHIMVAIDSRQLAIIQCALRKNAGVKHIQKEVELRVDPEDLAIIRYLQP